MQIFTRIKCQREYLPYIAFGIFFFLIQCFVIPYEGDDTYFLATIRESNNVLSFVQMRYATWSGRLTSELLIGLFSLCNMWIWRFINTVVMTGFIWTLSVLVKLASPKTEEHPSNLFMNSFVALSFFLIPISVTSRACSWYTGSFFYLWPTLCLILILITYIKYLFDLPLKKADYFICFIATLYAGFMEQTAAVMACFSIGILIYCFIKKRHFSFILMLQVLVGIGCLIIYSLAPGNKLRVASETLTWYPHFDELSLTAKVLQGINWTHTHFVRELSLLLLTLSIMLFLLILPKVRSISLKVLAFIPILYFIGMLFPSNRLLARTTSFEYLYDVESVLNKFFFNPMEGILPSIISLFIITQIGIMLFYVLDDFDHRYLVMLLYLASLCSGYVLGLSPTIFASGPRVFFLSDILIVIIGGITLGNLFFKVTLNPTIRCLSLIFYSSLSGIMAMIYAVGILAKSIFKIN